MVRKALYMPKRKGNLMEAYRSRENFEKALMNSSKEKRHRYSVRWCFAHKDRVFDACIRVKDVRGDYRPKIVIDSASGKVRNVLIPKYFPYQIVHHMIMQIAIPVFLKGSYQFSCGAIKDKGNLYASCYLRKILKTKVQETKYFVKLDIRHYYDNVDHSILKDKFRHYIKDKEFLGLLDSVVDSIPGEKGIPIGNYTSQIFANLYLAKFDEYIKKVLQIPFYVRYMDDIIILGSNKRVLSNSIIAIKEYLKRELKLETHGNEVVETTAYRDKNDVLHGHFIDFVGFKHYRGYTTIRKRTWKRIRRTMLRLNSKSVTNLARCRSFMSYYGYIIHSNSFGIETKYMQLAGMKAVRSTIRKEEVPKCQTMKESKLEPPPKSPK